MADSTSLKSQKSTTSSKPRTPGIDGVAKKVGFARPTLIIPPPQTQYNSQYVPYTPGGISMHSHHSYGQQAYGRKASMFMMHQFEGMKDIAKSGLGIGEKCSFWCYGKIRLLSKKWFTHCFLSIVLTLYTVGGALLFMYVEDMIFLVFTKVSRLVFLKFQKMITFRKAVNNVEDYLLISFVERNQNLIYFIKIIIISILGTMVPAYVFELIEGQNESQIVERDLRKDRYDLIRGLRNLSISMPDRTSDGEWEGAAARLVFDYESDIMAYYETSKLIMLNRGHKVWTLWNSIVFCATVYTTLGMESMPISPESSEINAIENKDERVDLNKIKTMVTEEQVHSDSVARRRRRFTKKRSTSLTRRDPTPVRNVNDKFTSDEEIVEQKPKTPERPRRPKRNKSLINHNLSETDTPSLEDSNKSNNVSRSSSFRSKLKAFEARVINENGPVRKKSLSDMAQDEMVAIFNKTKKSITNAAIKGRERFRKDKDVVKRSQSAPNKINDQELIESFKQAQLNKNANEENLTRCLETTKFTEKHRKYSDTSLNTIIPDLQFSTPIIKKARALRSDSVSLLRNRRKPAYSSKVIEVLDPQTRTVVSSKTILQLPKLRWRDLFKILRFYSLFEIIRAYRLYKIEMKSEYRNLKRLWNKCMFELFLLLMLCGTAGFIFKYTEGRFENYYKCGVKRVKRDFIDLLWTKSHNLREEDWKSLFRNKLRTFEEELHVAHEAGMKSYSGQRSWSFLNAVVYALTIVTTIGYGHIYPSTPAGRALTIVYALVGIPLFLIALTDFGKLFTRGIKFLWSFVRRLYYTGSCRKVRKSATASDIFRGAQLMYGIATFRRPSNTSNIENDRENGEEPPPYNNTQSHSVMSKETLNTVISDDTPTTPDLSTFEIDDEFNLPISVALFILVAYMFIGALVYCAWEEWEFFSAFYFVFISLSTVGFGDFIPEKPIILLLSIVYLVFGLALMSMCINVVQLKLSDTFQQASIKISSTMGFEVEEENSESMEVASVHSSSVIDIKKNESNDAAPVERFKIGKTKDSDVFSAAP